jgi:peptidoglycan/xylan/chitin deacetylase (PgdA/CDA1 family)
MSKATTKSLPVLMYHYVSMHQDSIAIDPGLFEEHLTSMTKAGYRGVSLSEATSYLLEGRELPAGSVLITFDDGFLDNYVYAYPLLKKHGHKGVVFAVTGKLENHEAPRPTLEDVWQGFVDARDLPMVDNPFRKNSEGLRVRRDMFLSWEETRLMQASGVMDISAHSHKHRSVFTGPDFETVFQPTGRKRTFDRIEQEVLYGLPRFAEGPALANRAFIPAPEIYDWVRDAVPQNLSPSVQFFKRPDAEKKILAKIREVPKDRLGRYETDDEFRARLHKELSTCREAIKRELGYAPTTLCWPWGACCPESEQIAKELGFKVFFHTTMGANPPGKRPHHVHRFKGKSKPGTWLLSRLGIYSSPVKAAVYGKMHG